MTVPLTDSFYLFSMTVPLTDSFYFVTVISTFGTASCIFL